MVVEPAFKITPVLAFLGRPSDFRESTGTGEGHILHLAPVEEILGPELGLAAEHALGLFGSEIVRNGLELVQEILRRTDSKSEIRFEPVGAGDIPSLDIGFLETHGRRMKTRFDDPASLRACQEGRGDSELLPSIWRFRLA